MGDEVVMHNVGDSIGKKSRSLLFELVSLPGIVHQSLVLFIAVVLVSESVAATPTRFSPLFKGGWGVHPALPNSQPLPSKTQLAPQPNAPVHALC
jgi:hypothetical protein